MSVLNPVTDDVYRDIDFGTRLLKLGYQVQLSTLVHPARLEYRQRAAEYFDMWFLEAINGELKAAQVSGAQFARGIGEEEGTVRRWLRGERGKRAKNMEFIFAAELWLPEVSPLQLSVLESARVAGMCAAVCIVRHRVTGLHPPKLTHREYWQLHHMFATPGWLDTPVRDDFVARCRADSSKAAKEFADTVEAAVRRPRPKLTPPLHHELVELSKEWGFFFLLTRFVLADQGDHTDIQGSAE